MSSIGQDKTLTYFASASKSQIVAREFAERGKIKGNETQIIFRIQSIKGRDIGQIAERPEQMEVLFNKGTKFRVLTYRKTDKGYIFDLEEI